MIHPLVTSSNNTIQVTVDGTNHLSIPTAHYTSEAALATAIQTAITRQCLTTAGKSVVVTHTNGSYSITSGLLVHHHQLFRSLGSNLDGFVKLVGTTDADNMEQSSWNCQQRINIKRFFCNYFINGLVKEQTLASAGTL